VWPLFRSYFDQPANIMTVDFGSSGLAEVGLAECFHRFACWIEHANGHLLCTSNKVAFDDLMTSAWATTAR
jgi:hypothetical protein